MFKLKRPCNNCPFARGRGEFFRLPRLRLLDIVSATGFQCHKTVDYSGPDRPLPGDHPQQCAGLMALLRAEDKPNQMMQLAERLNYADFKDLDPEHEAYQTLAEAFRAHGHRPPARGRDASSYPRMAGRHSRASDGDVQRRRDQDLPD